MEYYTCQETYPNVAHTHLNHLRQTTENQNDGACRNKHGWFRQTATVRYREEHETLCLQECHRAGRVYCKQESLDDGSDIRRLDAEVGPKDEARGETHCPYSAHPTIQMNNIELIFLPPNTTSVTQPMDAGIIKNLKFHYRYILANRKLETSDGAVTFSWNILEAIIVLKSSWNKVKPVTVLNCYSKVGLLLFVCD